MNRFEIRILYRELAVLLSTKEIIISEPIPALELEARLKRRFRRHLKKIGFKKGQDGSLVLENIDKNLVRSLHLHQRNEKIRHSKGFIESNLPKLHQYFANGSEVDPRKISPRLEIIQANTWQSNLFRLACLTWSIPVSQGFGRRMRFLVWDEQNGKLIGLIALGDPVFNLGARDNYIGWTSEDRRERLVNILDAYVLGSLPPYNQLLGGKLVSCLIRTSEIVNIFNDRYGLSRGIISGKEKKAQLTLVSTSSALGRSSVYNRLTLGGHKYFESKGMTGGWGHFHVPDNLFNDLRDYIRNTDHPYADGHKFGEGPNWKLRTIRAALDQLGFKADLLKHGIKREYLVCEMATNAKSVLTGKTSIAKYNDLLKVEEVSGLALERWIIPRSFRRPEFLEWKADQIRNMLKPQSLSNLPKLIAK